MKSLNEVTPWRTRASMSARVWSLTSRTITCRPKSTCALPAALASQRSYPAWRLSPASWIAKSTIVVVPPQAAAAVPVSKSSAENVPPKGMSRWVCASMPPGITYRPDASITVSAPASRPRPTAATDSPSTSTSAATVSPAVTTVPPRISVLNAVWLGSRCGGGRRLLAPGREHHHQHPVEDERHDEADHPAVVVERLEDPDDAGGGEGAGRAGRRVRAADRQQPSDEDADQPPEVPATGVAVDAVGLVQVGQPQVPTPD